MILKSFEINKIKLNNHKFYLFYGDNDGFKEEIIRNLFEKNYLDRIHRYEEKISWPSISKEELVEEEINFVVQINGKKKAILKINRDIDENSILNKIKLNIETEKLLQNQKIKKTIFVSNRLINIIL